VTTVDQAKRVSQTYFDLTDDIDLVVKAQILAGGRGKGHFENGFQSGVHICSSPDEVAEVAGKMLGHRLITIQSGKEGKPVNTVYVCERKYIRRETYLAIMMDRAFSGPVIVGSAVGGVNIEILAKEKPDAIFKEKIDPLIGVTQEQALLVAEKLGFKKGKMSQSCAHQVRILFDLFWNNDCTLVEINPFAETSTGEVLIMDAKINF